MNEKRVMPVGARGGQRSGIVEIFVAFLQARFHIFWRLGRASRLLPWAGKKTSGRREVSTSVIDGCEELSRSETIDLKIL